jgi:hypothetical protein
MSNDDSVAGDTLLPAVLAGLGALFVSILAGVALSTARDAIGLENITIIYMAVVAIAAIAGGTSGGLMAALGASLSYNFFFTTPYRTLRIDSFEQVATVALLFVAGALISFATNATRGRLFDDDEAASPSPSGDAAQLVDSVAHARANASGTNAGWVAVQGLQRLHDAQWVALIPFEDAPDRSVVWAGDPPTLEDAGAARSLAADGLRPRRRHPRGMGAAAHVFVNSQISGRRSAARFAEPGSAKYPAVLVVMPRPGQPLTGAVRTTVLAVAQALEADAMHSSQTSRGS